MRYVSANEVTMTMAGKAVDILPVPANPRVIPLAIPLPAKKPKRAKRVNRK